MLVEDEDIEKLTAINLLMFHEHLYAQKGLLRQKRKNYRSNKG